MWGILPVSASSYSGDIDFIIKLITYVVGVWTIAAYAVFFSFIFMSRKKAGRKAGYFDGKGKQMAWILVPVTLVAICDFALDIYNTPVWEKIKVTMPKTEETVRIVAQQWAWEFIYPGPDGLLDTADDVRTWNMLHVKQNAPTRFELVSKDVLHSFAIPVFRVKQDAIPGRMIQGWFEPILTGVYDVQCAEICGLGHTNMGARVTVHAPEKFKEALTAEATPVNSGNTVVAATANATPVTTTK